MAQLSDKLMAYPACPVCGSTDREPCTATARAPSPYTESLAASVGATAEAVLAAMPLWTCRRCRANWRDPWLTPEAAEWLYGTGRPLHRYGWISLQSWAEGRAEPFLAARAALWRHLRDRSPGPMRYAEFNCPFSGLAFAEADRFGAPGRNALRARQHRLAKGEKAPGIVADDDGGFLGDRTLLVASSPMCWGENCRAHGASCRELATGLLFRRTVTLDEAERGGERFDLVGAFILDHMPDPNRTLFRLLRLGRRVLLEMHAPGWTDAQHLYNLHPSLVEAARRSGVHVRNLTAATDHGGPSSGALLFMLSRDDDLAWLD